MNICKQSLSLTRNLYRNAFVSVARCSTTAVEKVTDEGEPDKLYRYLDLELRGNDAAVLKSYAQFSTMAAGHFNVESQSWSARKPQHERFTLLKSVHIYKKHRVQYEYRTYFHFIKFKHLTGSTCDTLLEYLERNLPEGVALKATKVELQNLPEHFVPPTDAKPMSP